MRSLSRAARAIGAGLVGVLSAAPDGAQAAQTGPFRRVATFPVFQNADVTVDSGAEIVAAANGGKLLVYTDAETESIGFVDITDPANPLADGLLPMSGGPTSVAVLGGFALVCVNTSFDFVNPSGNLEVIDLATRTIVRTIPLGGQPDAISISPNGRYAAIAIENERDEDLGSGEPPQAPPGFVVIVDLVGGPATWATRKVDLVGVPDLYPDDPEPEYVDISDKNVCVVTLQENNHIVLIGLKSGEIITDYPAGTPDLDSIDTNENQLIEQVDALSAVPREPDAVVWTSPDTFATADEGDLFGGSRGFTTWDARLGLPLFAAGATVEHLVARHGHYPEDRSENKGSEAESVEFSRYGEQKFLFVGSERANAVLVYELFSPLYQGNKTPVFRQLLPTGVAPEGMVAIPARNLFAVSCEADDRSAKFRGSIMIYEKVDAPNYPTVVSADRPGTGLPIPWAALSGLVTDPQDGDRVHAVHDSFYRASRIFGLDVGSVPAVITDELPITDGNDVLINALVALKAQLPGTNSFLPDSFINADDTVNLDLEGVGIDQDGFHWVASEGGGNLANGVSNPASNPFLGPNLLARVDLGGDIRTVVLPPFNVTKNQFRFGFEGVTVVGRQLYVCFQRAWANALDPADRARIGRYDLDTDTWTFAYYPLDTPTSPNGGWVGLSELTWLGGADFAVIERDDQGGPDARIKRIYAFSITGVNFQDESVAPAFDVLGKTLKLDLLLANTYGPTGGFIPEKLEGLAALPNGDALIVNDNDGVDDNNGETQLLRLVDLFD